MLTSTFNYTQRLLLELILLAYPGDATELTIQKPLPNKNIELKERVDT
jgi:hypothetical protein